MNTTVKPEENHGAKNDRTLYDRDKNLRMDCNITLKEIREAFKNCSDQPVKISKVFKAGIEFFLLSFITPQVGNRYLDLIHELEIWSLWDIRINPVPNHEMIRRAAKATLPESYRFIYGPVIDSSTNKIKVKVKPEMQPDDWEEWKEKFQALTDYSICLA